MISNAPPEQQALSDVAAIRVDVTQSSAAGCWLTNLISSRMITEWKDEPGGASTHSKSPLHFILMGPYRAVE